MIPGSVIATMKDIRVKYVQHIVNAQSFYLIYDKKERLLLKLLKLMVQNVRSTKRCSTGENLTLVLKMR